MPTTLVTAANGFVAVHIIDELIKSGHHVVGSVRALSKDQQILDLHPEYKNKLDFIVVSDYTKTGVWNETFKTHDFDHVIHVAAPLLDDPDNTDFVKHFLEPGVKGATELLKSATEYGKNVKSIVVTGSINSLTTGADVLDRDYNSQEWLPLSIADAIAAANSYISYCVSKAEAEKAMWVYMKEMKPSFSLTVLLPALIFGPPIQPTTIKNLNFSSNVIYQLINGSKETIPQTAFPSYIDVRDLAHAHVLSLTNKKVANERLIVGGLAYSNQLAADVLKTLPETKNRVAKDSGESTPKVRFTDVKEWNEKLGLALRSSEETFGDMARKLLELETAEK